MKTRKIIAEALNNLLETSEEPICILLKGEWGIGKTYFIKNQFCPSPQTFECIYLPLSDKKDLEDVQKSLLTKIAFSTEDGHEFIKVALETLGNIFPKFAGINPILEYISTKLIARSAGKKAAKKKLVVVFDEIERIPENLKSSELLSFFSYLKEQLSLRLILIMNEAIIMNPDNEFSRLYKEFKEKIIDYEISFSPNFSENFSIVIKDENPPWKEIFKSYCKKHGIVNIRILKRLCLYLRGFDFIEDFKELREEVKKELYTYVVSLGFLYIRYGFSDFKKLNEWRENQWVSKLLESSNLKSGGKNDKKASVNKEYLEYLPYLSEFSETLLLNNDYLELLERSFKDGIPEMETVFNILKNHSQKRRIEVFKNYLYKNIDRFRYDLKYSLTELNDTARSLIEAYKEIIIENDTIHNIIEILDILVELNKRDGRKEDMNFFEQTQQLLLKEWINNHLGVLKYPYEFLNSFLNLHARNLASKVLESVIQSQVDFLLNSSSKIKETLQETLIYGYLGEIAKRLINALDYSRLSKYSETDPEFLKVVIKIYKKHCDQSNEELATFCNNMEKIIENVRQMHPAKAWLLIGDEDVKR